MGAARQHQTNLGRKRNQTQQTRARCIDSTLRMSISILICVMLLAMTNKVLNPYEIQQHDPKVFGGTNGVLSGGEDKVRLDGEILLVNCTSYQTNNTDENLH